MQQLPLGVRLADREVFESFHPGRNAQAVEHAIRIAAGELAGASWYCGASGSGKTHLLQAICARASAESAGYFPLRELSAYGAGVLEGLSALACVCVDDVGRVIGDPAWERALFALWRELEERGGRLVAAAPEPAALQKWSLADLGSRFSAAAIFQLRVLDEREQREALELRARLRGFELPEETSRWLQRRFPRDMRTLYGLLDTLDEAALIAQRRLTVPFIRSVLKE